MFVLRPDPQRALEAARRRSPTAADWMTAPSAEAHRVHHSVALPASASLEGCGRALLDWSLHRRAGLRVAADGAANVGTTVVLGLRAGPLWVLAPCRVVAVVDESDEVGFDYATLPGHPERGVERFAVRRVDGGLSFEVTAWSVPAFWGSRLLPRVARQVQGAITQRYLRAAQDLAR